MNGEFTVTTAASQSLYDLIVAAGALSTTNIPNLHGSGTIVLQNNGANSIWWNTFGDAVATKAISITAGNQGVWTNEGVTHKVIDSLKNIRVIAETADVLVGIAIV